MDDDCADLEDYYEDEMQDKLTKIYEAMEEKA